MADWWRCPNDPPCPHPGVLHDVEDFDDTRPRCCVDGCTCGHPLLVATIGLPGSGKTTWAREWVENNPTSRARVNRDDLRSMLFGGWTGNPDHEDTVTAVQHTAVMVLLRAGRDVVCDDTNLHPEHLAALRDLAARAGADFDTRNLTDVPVNVCIERDAARAARGERHVGEHVIRSMAARIEIRGRR